MYFQVKNILKNNHYHILYHQLHVIYVVQQGSTEFIKVSGIWNCGLGARFPNLFSPLVFVVLGGNCVPSLISLYL
jgi:hypothetical protein